MTSAASPSLDAHPGAVSSPGDWIRLTVGLAAVYLMFELIARSLGSDRGQHGFLIALLVTGALAIVECTLWNEPISRVLRSLGLGRPALRGLLAAFLVASLLILVASAYFAVTSTAVSMVPNWAGFLPGLFAQAGIAEEVLFRGYLFRRVRVGRSFWRAAATASLPFIAVHLLMFTTMPWAIALVATVLAATVSFPLAYLFERGGNTIWAPAIVHWIIQGFVKIVVVNEVTPTFPLVWMAASATLPFVVFLLPRRARSV